MLWQECSGPMNAQRLTHLRRSELTGQPAGLNSFSYSANRLSLHDNLWCEWSSFQIRACNTYALTFSGFSTRGPVPAAINAFTPIAGGGLVTFDGNGNVSASETASIGGLITPVNVPGTYTVNSDCTGTFITTPNAQLNLVILRHGREIQAVNTVPGNVILDNFVKQ